MSTIRRLYFALVAFIALNVAANGAVNLLSTIVRAVLEPQAGIIADPGFWRQQVASAASMLVVALPIWFFHWRWMERTARDLAEAAATSRRLYLLLVLGVAAITALFQATTFVRVALHLLLGVDAPPYPPQGVPALVRALGWVTVYGALWFYHAPYAARGAPGMAGSTLRRWYLYVVTAVALSGVAWGAWMLFHAVLDALLTPGGALLLGGGSNALLRQMLDSVPWIVLGGLWWHLFFQRLAAGDEGSLLRQVYLYGAVTLGLIAALSGVSWLLYELLRFLFGYRAPTLLRQLDFLSNALPLLAVGASVWLYHRRRIQDEAAAGELPARIFRYLTAAAGLLLWCVGLAGLIGLLMDFAFGAFPELHSEDWWRDSLSSSLVLVIVGLPLWLLAWTESRRAAAADPGEVVSLARRAYLFAVLLIAVLTLLGFLAVALNSVLQLLLGQPATARLLSDLFSRTGYAAIAGAVLGYHALIARKEMGMSAPAAAPARHQVLVLATPGAESALDGLTAGVGGSAEVRTLRIRMRIAPPDPAALTKAVESAPTERVLVILRSDGAEVYGYE